MSTGRKTDILQLLRANREYVSGQQICDSFGISRTAVWKVMNQLKADGYQIEAVQNKGYLLVDTPDVLSESELASRMKTKWAGKALSYFDVTDSTNIQAKQQAENGAPHGLLVVADQQESGRGRRGKNWESPAGQDIYMTLLLRPKFTPDKASMLTLVMALAVTRAVEAECRVKAKIKWPNDIVVDGKKICGILTEMNTEPDYIQYVVIGVGINANQTEFPKELQQTASSLQLILGKEISRAALIECAMEEFEAAYERFCRSGDLSGLMEEYNQRLVSVGKQVRVLDPQGEYTAISQGITAAGELLVTRDTGEIVRVYAGEVSVRGIYGYV